MSRLKGTEELAIPPEMRVGRSQSCDLRVEQEKVSREHGVIRWTGSQWRLRDFGSTNGTFHNGNRLRPGEEVVLAKGDRINFGGGSEWSLLSEAAPVAEAISEGQRIKAWAGALILPDGSKGEVVIRRGPKGWVLERAGKSEGVNDRKVVSVGGQLWTLRLPEVLPPTTAEEGRQVESQLPDPDLSLKLEVEGEKVHAVLFHREGSLDLKTRSPNRALHLLAKERLRDRRRGVAEGDAGWVSPEDAADHLGISTNTWYVWLWRLRAASEEAKIGEADRLVERRFTGEVRLGISRIELIEA